MIIALSAWNVKSQNLTNAIVDSRLIFEEQGGLVAAEAEFFYKQSLTEIRQWYITSSGNLPTVTPNPDEAHIAGASGNAYIEVLPDTRVTSKDKLIKFEDPGSTGETAKLVNFTDVPGKLAVLHYKVKINHPGRYYVWVRAYSSGAEDNGLHVLDSMETGLNMVSECSGAKVKTNGHGLANNEQKRYIAVNQKKSTSISTKPVFTKFSLVCAKTDLKWINSYFQTILNLFRKEKALLFIFSLENFQ